jgi:hypothetical protein
MGVAPLHGRDFVEGDDAPGAPAVAVISHSVWQQFFSGDLGLLGEAVVMNDIPHTVVGILPQDFVYGGTRLAVYVPLQLDEDPLYGGANYMVLGRMPAQGDIEGSRADMARIFNVYREANPNALPDNLLGIGLVRFQDAYAENARPLLVVLSGAVGFVLLIACANVANLLMSRTNTRQREIATRVAIGAGSARILRQLVTEGLVLSLCAGVVGVLIARFIIDILVGLSPLFGVMAREASIDFRVLAFSFIISNHFCHYGHALWS